MKAQNSEEFQRLIEHYRQDMMSRFVTTMQQNNTVLSTPVQATPHSTVSEDAQDIDIGQLQVRVSTENQAIPLPEAVVTITKETPNGRELIRTVLTDESGVTPLIDLKTKDRRLSLVPGQPSPYDVYTVEVVSDGYFPKVFTNVPIYGGVVAIQSVSMIPLPENGDNDVVLTYPESAPAL